MFKNARNTFKVVNKNTDETVAGPFDDATYAMNETNKWYALYNIKCKVVEVQTNRFVYEIPEK